MPGYTLNIRVHAQWFFSQDSMWVLYSKQSSMPIEPVEAYHEGKTTPCTPAIVD